MHYRRLHIIALLVSLFSVLALSASAEETTEPFVVVIDPGHGGKDVGCVGNITNERTIVLDVATRLGKLIAENHPDVKVVYTREDNTFIELQDRARIANKAGGNLFISIHVNSVDKRNRNRKSIHGASVYTLGLHKSESNLAVAMRENAVIELEDDFSEQYEGFDPNSSESYIIFELNQNVHMQKSVEFADIIQRELVSTAKRADKGVRQAGFWVLWATSMPSVLVELDFICNNESEKFMASNNGKDLLALSLSNAFDTYYTRHGQGQHTPRVGRSVSVDSLPTDNQPSKPTAKPAAGKSKQPTFHVQILSSKKVIKKNDAEIKGVKDLHYVRDGKFYKYYCGEFKTREDAKKHLTKMKKRFPQAFIIKIDNGKIVK